MKFNKNLVVIIAGFIIACICFGCGLEEKNKIEDKAALKQVEVKTATVKEQSEAVKSNDKANEVGQQEESNIKVPLDNKDIVEASTFNILIDKSDYKLYLKKGSEIIHTYNIAVGKNLGQKQRPGDLTTPTGSFVIDEIIDSSAWTHDFGDGQGEITGAYGPWFLSLATEWDGIGIHGTHDPSSIGTRASEGCIRLLNKDIVELEKEIDVGTKVVIQE